MMKLAWIEVGLTDFGRDRLAVTAIDLFTSLETLMPRAFSRIDGHGVLPSPRSMARCTSIA